MAGDAKGEKKYTVNLRLDSRVVLVRCCQRWPLASTPAAPCLSNVACLPDVHALQLPVTVLGDVVLSLDTAARQAAERGHSLLTEARVLLVHGVLHLLGYDHELGGSPGWH